MKSRKIIFMRHGETNWNSLGKLNSFTDLNILEKSHTEVLEMAKKLSDIDEIICSPMIRTQETAKIISKELGVPVVLEKEIVELNFGKFEGFSPAEIEKSKKLLPDFLLWRAEDAFSPKGVESFDSVVVRAQSFFEKLKKSDKNILVVTHGVFTRIFLMHCVLGSQSFLYRNLKLDNGKIVELEFEKDLMRLSGFNN